jgi:hypothetical protein
MGALTCGAPLNGRRDDDLEKVYVNTKTALADDIPSARKTSGGLGQRIRAQALSPSQARVIGPLALGDNQRLPTAYPPQQATTRLAGDPGRGGLNNYAPSGLFPNESPQRRLSAVKPLSPLHRHFTLDEAEVAHLPYSCARQCRIGRGFIHYKIFIIKHFVEYKQYITLYIDISSFM